MSAGAEVLVRLRGDRPARVHQGAAACTPDDVAHLTATIGARTICAAGRPRCILNLGHAGDHLPHDLTPLDTEPKTP